MPFVVDFLELELGEAPQNPARLSRLARITLKSLIKKPARHALFLSVV
jgi:hypothetical protein